MHTTHVCILRISLCSGYLLICSIRKTAYGSRRYWIGMKELGASNFCMRAVDQVYEHEYCIDRHVDSIRGSSCKCRSRSSKKHSQSSGSFRLSLLHMSSIASGMEGSSEFADVVLARALPQCVDSVEIARHFRALDHKSMLHSCTTRPEPNCFHTHTRYPFLSVDFSHNGQRDQALRFVR